MSATEMPTFAGSGAAAAASIARASRPIAPPTLERIGRDGRAVRYYPSEVSFRLTATGRGHLQGIDAAPVDTHADLNDYLLGLHFRLKVFRGVNFRFIEPQSVEMLGMPADINYDERIYHISFNLDHVPAEDRIVLEVLDSSGERVSRFHLELM